ncbi:MAG TPA: RNA-binding protein [Candidatus Kryptonia bacterium]
MNIYVGNISRELSEDELREAFAAFGQVSTVNIIKDKFTGEYRGFAFVEMPVKEEAQAAINGLNGKDLKGRALNVNEARPRTDDRRGGGGGGRGGPRRNDGGGRRRF